MNTKTKNINNYDPYFESDHPEEFKQHQFFKSLFKKDRKDRRRKLNKDTKEWMNNIEK